MKKKALCLHFEYFCMIWKSENVTFKQATKELKGNFKIVNKNLTEENVNFQLEYINS